MSNIDQVYCICALLYVERIVMKLEIITFFRKCSAPFNKSMSCSIHWYFLLEKISNFTMLNRTKHVVCTHFLQNKSMTLNGKFKGRIRVFRNNSTPFSSCTILTHVAILRYENAFISPREKRITPSLSLARMC